MKKFIASFILFFSVFSLSFADNFLSHRYFEIKVDTPFLFFNNNGRKIIKHRAETITKTHICTGYENL